VFVLDHTSKEDRFLNDVKKTRVLSDRKENALKKEFERIQHECARKSGDLTEILRQLENADWAR
jgi:hypothetical protein